MTALAGTRVLEVGATRGSAFACHLLRLAGAEVERVDVPGAADLSAAAEAYLLEGIGWVERPAPDSWSARLDVMDVLLTDLRADELAELGLDLAAVRREHPRLVTVALAPSRLRRWPARRTCGELAMQSESGFLHMTGRPDGEPLGIPWHLGCSELGIHAAAAATAALLRREHLGDGAEVELFGSEILGSYLRIYGAVSEYYNIPLKRDGRRAPGSGGRYPFGIFPCRDGCVALIGRTARDWEKILTMMGDPPWARQDRYRDLHGIAMDYPDEVDELMAPWFGAHTRAELLELAQRHSIPMAPVRRIDELTGDPQFCARDFFRTVTYAGHDIQVPGLPWLTSRAPVAAEDVAAHPEAADRV